MTKPTTTTAARFDVNKRADLGPRVRKASRQRGGRVVDTLGVWQQHARIGGGLTPAAVSQIIREADAGMPARLIALANECRQQDSHLHAVLTTHEEGISGLPWQVVAPTPDGREKPKAADRRAAAWCEARLRECTGFSRLVSDLAGAYFYGFAVVEIVWAKKAGRLAPVEFVLVEPGRFRFRSEDAVLVLADMGRATSGVDLRATYPNKFVYSCPRVNGDTAQREGMKSPLVWMSVMRRWVISDWLTTGEMAWKPWRIGKYKQASAGRQDKADLETILRRMTTDFTAVIPDSTEISVEWPGGSATRGSTHGELCGMLAGEMSKCVLGQTETTQASSSSGYAQAKVHNEVRLDLREARAKQIANDITRDLIAAMTRLNFGPKVNPGRLEFITQDAADLGSFSVAIKTLTQDAKLPVPVAWVYEQTGIPAPRGNEPVLGPQPEDANKPPPPPPPSPAPPSDDEEPTPTDDEGDDEEPTPNDEGDDNAAQTAAPPLTFAERHAAFLADLRDLRDLGFAIDDDEVARLAGEHGVDPPRKGE